MIGESLHRTMFLFLLALTLSACAATSPTIGDTVSVRSVGHESWRMADVTETVLIGGGGNDWGNTILCQSDGACALFGYGIKSFGESTDLFAAMQSPQGKWLWANTYGGTHKDELRTAIKTSDGGYLLVGMSQSLFFTGLKVFGPSRPARP